MIALVRGTRCILLEELVLLAHEGWRSLHRHGRSPLHSRRNLCSAAVGRSVHPLIRWDCADATNGTDGPRRLSNVGMYQRSLVLTTSKPRPSVLPTHGPLSGAPA